jgi:hypothetical protein
MRELICERNRLANLNGFSNFYLLNAGMDMTHIRQILGELRSALDVLRPRIASVLALTPQPSLDLHPYAGRITDASLMLRQTAQLMGVSPCVIDAVLESADLYPRRYKDRFWFASQIDPPFDVRVHTNIQRSPAPMTLNNLKAQLLHEVFGHGVDCRSIDPAMPPLLRQQDSFTAEAVALLSEELVYEPRWLRHVFNISTKEMEELMPKLWRLQLTSRFEDLPHLIAIVEFEIELYRDPHQDLDAAYAKAMAWAWNDPSLESRIPPGSWAVDVPHYLSYPTYCHNYVLGMAWAVQVRQSLRKRFGTYASRSVGPFMARHRRTGLLNTPEEQIMQITKRPLGADDLIAELCQLATLLEGTLSK